MPYPTRYCTYVVPMERQQLQHQPREKRKVQWYYYHSYGSHWTIHYSLHPAYNTDSDTTSSSSRMVVTLSSLYQVIHTNMTQLYHRTIYSITRGYVYAWNNSGVNILGETDEHGHDKKFNKQIDIIIHQHENPL